MSVFLDKPGIVIGLRDVNFPKGGVDISIPAVPDVFIPIEGLKNLLEEPTKRVIDLGNGKKLTITFELNNVKSLNLHSPGENQAELTTHLLPLNEVANVVAEGFDFALLGPEVTGRCEVTVKWK